jgi:hypothetical protein
MKWNRLFALTSVLALTCFAGTPQWVAQEDSPKVRILESGVQQFDLPWPKLEGWRFYWDLQGQFQFHSADRILVHLQSDLPQTAGVAILYFQSGEGWYRFPAVQVPRDTVLFLEKSKASEEGPVAGWDRVSRVRIGFMPTDQRDSSAVRLVQLAPYAQWRVEDVGQVGTWSSYSELRDSLVYRMTYAPDSLSLRNRIVSVDSLLEDLQKNPVPQDELRIRVQKGRKLLAEALALSLPRSTSISKGFWLDPKEWGYSSATEREFVAKELFARHVKGVFLRTPLRGGVHEKAEVRRWVRSLIAQNVPVWLWVQLQPLAPCEPMQMNRTIEQVLELTKDYEGAALLLDGWRAQGIEASKDGSKACQQMYANQAIPKTSDALQFRIDQMTQSLRSLRQQSTVPIGLSVYSFPDVARSSVLEDWGAWAHQGLIDLVVTQTFSSDYQEFVAKVEKQRAVLPKGFPLWPGMLIGTPDQPGDLAVLSQQWMFLDQQGLTGAAFAELHPGVFSRVLPLMP